MSETSNILHDCRVHYPHIYGFATKTMEIHCIKLELWSIFSITEKKQSHFYLTWCCPCINQGQTETSNIFYAATDLGQMTSRLVNIWENGIQETCS